MASIDIGNPKMTRESLCYAQSILNRNFVAMNDISGQQRKERALKTLQHMIDEIDILRPLGPDGKHGDRHTPDCGCEVPCKNCGELMVLLPVWDELEWMHEVPAPGIYSQFCNDENKNKAEPL